MSKTTKKEKKLLKFDNMLMEKRPLSQLRKFLACNEVDLNSSGLGAFYEMPLHHAVHFHFDTEIVNLLIAYGANINVYDDLGSSILHYAVGNLSCPQMVKKVLEVGVPFSVADENGDRPIHWAAAIGNIPAIEILLEAGEEINVHGQWNKTPLHFAAEGRCENAQETIKFLLDHGADLWAEEEHGFLPITEAHHSDELLPFFASIMPGKIRDRNSDDFITFTEFIQRYGCWQLGSALVNMKPIKKS